mgnify:CR=1 FL=1|tara:strand:+ start:9529 stop:10890 length:1362 start_codon:yes stop_codon:yes gene_type:complete
MDDYDVSSLSESKNEWGARLVNILTPSVIEGVKSIFSEADKLCRENDEEEKYLMTFQNLLARVAKWNSAIIDEETKRIMTTSQCEYLEDLVTCVHIVHLKALTSIRVSSKQKKVDVDVPKVSDFVHRVYVAVARNVYKNVYLFEKGIAPLQYQKNMRELEVIVKECVLNTVRESIPVAQILRAYIDETVEEEEVVEENIEIIQPEKEEEEEEEETTENGDNTEKSAVEKSDSTDIPSGIIKKDSVETSTNSDSEITSIGGGMAAAAVTNATQDASIVTEKLTNSAEQLHQAAEKLNDTAEVLNVNTSVSTPTQVPVVEVSQPIQAPAIVQPTTLTTPEPVNTRELVAAPTQLVKKAEETATQSALSFNDTDNVFDMGTNQTSEIEAPKTIDRLEQISEQRNEQRKIEEEEDEEDEVLKIHNDPISLDNLEVQDVSSKLKISDDPILGDIEVLS